MHFMVKLMDSEPDYTAQRATHTHTQLLAYKYLGEYIVHLLEENRRSYRMLHLNQSLEDIYSQCDRQSNTAHSGLHSTFKTTQPIQGYTGVQTFLGNIYFNSRYYTCQIYVRLMASTAK